MKRKRDNLEELFYRAVLRADVIFRNKHAPVQAHKDSRLNLPFHIVNSEPGTKMRVSTSVNERLVFCNYSKPFKIHDDTDVLKNANITPLKEHVEALIPQEMLHMLPPRIYPATSTQEANLYCYEQISATPPTSPSVPVAGASPTIMIPKFWVNPN